MELGTLHCHNIFIPEHLRCCKQALDVSLFTVLVNKVTFQVQKSLNTIENSLLLDDTPLALITLYTIRN